MYVALSIALFLIASVISFVMGYWVFGIALVVALIYWVKVEQNWLDEYGQE